MRARRASGCALALAGLVGLSACGDDEERVNKERPAATINVTAAIVDGRVEVSPRRFGAGPIRLLVTNQTATTQALTFETDEVGGDLPGLQEKTGPINPSGTTTLEVDVREGDYAVKTADRGIKPATLAVGAARPSAQDQLLQP
jgi:hypothetical protein